MTKPFELYRLDDHYPDYFSSDRQGREGYDELKKPVEALEKAPPDLRERMVSVETLDKVMDTKADICDLKVLMTEGFNRQAKRFVVTAAVLAGVVFAAARLIH